MAIGADTARLCPGADLNQWAAFKWADGVQLETLTPLQSLVIQTKNTAYDITVLHPRTGDILIQGGRFFPLPTRAKLGGSSLGGSFLKLLGIYTGFCMEIWHDGQAIVTTRVRSMRPADSLPSH